MTNEGKEIRADATAVTTAIGEWWGTAARSSEWLINAFVAMGLPTERASAACTLLRDHYIKTHHGGTPAQFPPPETIEAMVRALNGDGSVGAELARAEDNDAKAKAHAPAPAEWCSVTFGMKACVRPPGHIGPHVSRSLTQTDMGKAPPPGACGLCNGSGIGQNARGVPESPYRPCDGCAGFGWRREPWTGLEVGAVVVGWMKGPAPCVGLGGRFEAKGAPHDRTQKALATYASRLHVMPARDLELIGASIDAFANVMAPTFELMARDLNRPALPILPVGSGRAIAVEFSRKRAAIVLPSSQAVEYVDETTYVVGPRGEVEAMRTNGPTELDRAPYLTAEGALRMRETGRFPAPPLPGGHAYYAPGLDGSLTNHAAKWAAWKAWAELPEMRADPNVALRIARLCGAFAMGPTPDLGKAFALAKRDLQADDERLPRADAVLAEMRADHARKQEAYNDVSEHVRYCIGTRGGR